MRLTLAARVKDELDEVFLSVEDVDAFVHAGPNEFVWVEDSAGGQSAVKKADLHSFRVVRDE